MCAHHGYGSFCVRMSMSPFLDAFGRSAAQGSRPALCVLVPDCFFREICFVFRTGWAPGSEFLKTVDREQGYHRRGRDAAR